MNRFTPEDREVIALLTAALISLVIVTFIVVSLAK